MGYETITNVKVCRLCCVEFFQPIFFVINVSNNLLTLMSLYRIFKILKLLQLKGLGPPYQSYSYNKTSIIFYFINESMKLMTTLRSKKKKGKSLQCKRLVWFLWCFYGNPRKAEISIMHGKVSDEDKLIYRRKTIVNLIYFKLSKINMCYCCYFLSKYFW